MKGTLTIGSMNQLMLYHREAAENEVYDCLDDETVNLLEKEIFLEVGCYLCCNKNKNMEKWWMEGRDDELIGRQAVEYVL